MEPSEVRRRGLKLLAVAAAAVTAGAMTAGSPAAAAPAEGQVLGAGAADVVPGSYIVALKANATARSSVQSLAGRYGGAVKHTYSHALNGFAANLTETQAKRLAADPSVEYVQADSVVTISGTQANPPSWGLDRIDQRNLPLDSSYTYPDVTQAVTAYVIDTGVRTSHGTFGGRASWGNNTSGDGNNSDCNGHGTHVAGTIGGSQFGVAKTVSIVAVKVLDCSGNGTNAGVIAGVDWVTANARGKLAVANMSLGGGANQPLDTAVANSIASGVTYAVAAGNSNGANACSYSPARTATAITVGSTTNTDARSSFSNVGTCVDIFAPGSNITSAWRTSDTATNTISGTSMASPHVAGAAALLKAQNPTWTPQQIRDAMVANATPNKVTSPGSGSPNLLLNVGGGTVEPPPPPPPGCSGTNGTDVMIPDNTTVYSDIAISGCNRNASATASVTADIRHTYRGDLVVDLVAPDGSTYNLHNGAGGSADNLSIAATVNLSSEAASGTWRLRVQDTATFDTGYVNTWSLTV
ncbi:serine protease [Virgisporangium ochraceum]|uniref:Serine protease n=1 Tax=Virgisporangium ochraceum TaxID=65505 RepID=A0A8J3ZR02_9ACTN|nr:S8 family peptidase [Virgisporangium ochraceum]GIJ66338.1 serine protease [Virgisporangium ochraceum]